MGQAALWGRVHGCYVVASAMLREHPQQQEDTLAPEHSLVSHSQTCQVKLRSPSPTLPCPKKPMSKQMSSKQLEGAEGGLGELTYRFRNPQMLGVCWTCSQHCWRHTGTLCRKSCLPLGPPTGRRTSGTLESTGTVPGSLPPGRAACRAQNRSGEGVAQGARLRNQTPGSASWLHTW